MSLDPLGNAMRKWLTALLVDLLAVPILGPSPAPAQKGPIRIGMTDEHVLGTMGDEVLGVITPLHYSAALENPANKRFAQAYEAKFKQTPSSYSEGTYVAGLVLEAALEATGGDIENVDRFLGALRKVDLSDMPRGPVRFDDYGNPVMNIYVRKVEKVNGRLQNSVIQTFPNVSQFWTYTPEEFLEQPVYDRNNPPCKHC
jgi:branched-chain amino acid transport system substrate-binding protein